MLPLKWPKRETDETEFQMCNLRVANFVGNQENWINQSNPRGQRMGQGRNLQGKEITSPSPADLNFFHFIFVA